MTLPQNSNQSLEGAVDFHRGRHNFKTTICCQALGDIHDDWCFSLSFFKKHPFYNFFYQEVHIPTFYSSSLSFDPNPFSLFPNVMMNAAAPALEIAAFQPIMDGRASTEWEEALSPLAIFRDGENGATGMHLLMQRANPIDSMDCSQHEEICEAADNGVYEDDIVWTDAHQRVISPFPDDENHDVPHTDSWKDVAVEHVDFSHFFPSSNAAVMECDDFSLSSADGEEDLVLADDLSNPESFWELGSNLSRSPSPAQVSIGSDASSNGSTASLFPPSPTSTTQVHELDMNKHVRLMPC